MKYGNNDHTIIHGDSTEALAALPSESVDLVFLDPPYNIGKQFGDFKDAWPSDEEYIAWCAPILSECVRALKPTGSMYFMTSTQAMPYFDILLRKNVEIVARIVWSYDSSGVQAKKYYGSMYEPILFCVKDKKRYTFNADDILVEARTGSVRKLIDYRGPVPKPYNTKKVPGNVWDIPRVRYRMDEYENHPTQKPEALLERIIRASSNPGDLILDPFSGTFTTSAVAKRLGRRSVGIERHKEYVKVGLRRVLNLQTHDGEVLARTAKSTERKNFRGVKGGARLMESDMFDVGS
jgi:site-specific DNA-methyltransferase (adenine-specific)